jgi:hypothetical protein
VLPNGVKAIILEGGRLGVGNIGFTVFLHQDTAGGGCVWASAGLASTDGIA